MSKSLYIVTAYRADNENTIFTNTYKLQELGTKSKRYIFVSLENSGGLGTAVDGFGSETIEDAIIHSLNFVAEGFFKYLRTDKFDEVLSIRTGFINKLTVNK